MPTARTGRPARVLRPQDRFWLWVRDGRLGLNRYTADDPLNMSNHTQNRPDISVGRHPFELQAKGISGWGLLLAACGLVLTGHLLGVAWLSEAVLGLPAGLWCIGLGMGIWSEPVRKHIAGGAERLWGLFEHSGRVTAIESDEAAEDTETSMGWWPRHQVASVCVDAISRAVACVVRVAWLPVWGGELSVVANTIRVLAREFVAADTASTGRALHARRRGRGSGRCQRHQSGRVV